MPRFTYGYWDIRGLAQATRIMLHMYDADWENKAYTTGPAPDFDPKAWTDEKFTLGMDFPNLPYLFDTEKDVKLTQSMAIMRYVAAETAPELLKPGSKLDAHIDMLAHEAMDLRNFLVGVYYGQKTKEDALEAIKPVSTKLQILETYLGRERDGPFLVGPLCYVDFFLAEQLDQLEYLVPGTLAAFPKLSAYHTAFFDLPKVKEYVSTHEQLPVNGPMACMY